MPGQAGRVGVRAEFAEAQRETLLIGERHVLIAKEDHAVAEERVFDLGEGPIVDVLHLHARNLRTHSTRERQDGDVVVFLGAVVEGAGGMKFHGVLRFGAKSTPCGRACRAITPTPVRAAPPTRKKLL